MEVYYYKVENQDIRNVDRNVETLQKVLAGIKNPKETIIDMDYSDVIDPIVTTSTGLIFKKIVDVGFPKIIIHNHKKISDLMDQPVIKLLVQRQLIEFK